jgi:hypothetical protein
LSQTTGHSDPHSSGTVTRTSSVPTVIENLYKQKQIETESIGIYYAPTTRKGEFNGEITFGGADKSRYVASLSSSYTFSLRTVISVVDNIHYVPITQQSPANRYWGVDQTLSYGKDKVILQSAGIIDTGTTLLLLATDAFRAYQDATGAVLDE